MNIKPQINKLYIKKHIVNIYKKVLMKIGRVNASLNPGFINTMYASHFHIAMTSQHLTAGCVLC